MSIFCRILLPSLIVGLLASMWIHLRPFDSPQTYYFNVHLTSDRDGRARVYWDTGHGFAEYASIGSPIHAGTDTYRFPLPPAKLQTLRLWPLDRAGKVTIHRAAVASGRGETLHVFPTSRLVRTAEETGAAADENGITLQTKPGEGLDFKPGEPLVLAPKWSIPLQQAGVDCAIIAASIALLLLLIELFGPLRRFLAKPAIALRSGFEAVPVLTLCITAVAAAVLSCYPVVFAGKSFVSPGNGALLLYDDVPTVPRAPVELPEDPAGSDVGALMWAHLPYSAIQHRAIFQHGELPLWNRYNYCGTPLLAQGLTMIGDPLHWLTIASGGANWAWDVKFLCAKALFALGVGLCVRAATGGLWVAVLCAVSSAFLGFFSYRFSHPAFFALCYAPWILLPWFRVAITTGRIWPWVIGLALANFWQLNSGVVKESLALIIGLNFTGGLLVLLGLGSGGARLRRLLAMSWGLVLFALLSAPCWLVFFDALRSAWTPYSAAKVFQIQPSLFIGLFDDLFYRQLVPWENHFNPAANFLILLGCIWAVVNIRGLLRNSAFLAVLLGSVPPALLVFGIIPPSLIADVPFLGQVQHVDNTFSVVLIIHLLVLAAFGLRSLWQNTARLSVDSLLAATIFAVLLGLYFGYAQASHREGHSLWAAGTSARFTIFFLGYSIALMLAVLALPWAVWSLRRVPNFGALLIAALALIAMHFRHGMWTDTPFDRYVMNPREAK